MKIGFFDEAVGQRSEIRLIAFMLVLFAIVMSGAVGAVGLVGYACGTGGSLMEIVTAVVACAGSLSALGIGAKLGQKPMEKFEQDTSVVGDK